MGSQDARTSGPAHTCRREQVDKALYRRPLEKEVLEQANKVELLGLWPLSITHEELVEGSGGLE